MKLKGHVKTVIYLSGCKEKLILSYYLNNKVFCLKLKISKTTNLMEFLLRKLYIEHWIVSGISYLNTDPLDAGDTAAGSIM